MDNDWEQDLIDAGRGHLLPSYWSGAELRYRQEREEGIRRIDAFADAVDAHMQARYDRGER